MRRERFLDLLDSDGQLLLATAAGGDLGAAVPTCPGWTVRDAVTHTAEVYEHKIECVRLAGARPDPWPPEWPDRDPVEWYGDAFGRLLDVLRETDPAAPSWTWWPPDQTAGFWVRRMAQETAVHRVDVQSAYAAVTPVDADLAVDGVDEVLVMMLAGDWTDEPQPDLNGTVAVATGDRSWRVVMSRDSVEVTAGGDAGTTVTGAPSDLLLWLWGRASDDAVTVAGDTAAAARFRERLALATR